MKKNTLVSRTGIAVATVFATSMLLSSCNTPAQKVDNAKEEVTDAKEDLDKAREEYRAEVASFKSESDAKIAANEQLIAELKVKIKESKRAAKSESAELIEAAERQNASLKTRLADFNDDSKEKWQSFKTEFNNDMFELGKSLEGLTTNNVK